MMCTLPSAKSWCPALSFPYLIEHSVIEAFTNNKWMQRMPQDVPTLRDYRVEGRRKTSHHICLIWLNQFLGRISTANKICDFEHSVLHPPSTPNISLNKMVFLRIRSQLSLLSQPDSLHLSFAHITSCQWRLCMVISKKAS